MNCFCTTYTLVDNTLLQRRRAVRTEEVIGVVERRVERDPNESIRHRAQQLELYPSTLQKILRKDLGLQVYKIHLVQELKPRDHHVGHTFGEWADNNIQFDPLFQREILFSDEAYFWFNGYVNKQNCRIWSEENLEAFIEMPLRPSKVIVQRTLWAGGYLFKEDAGQNITINVERYRAIIADFFVPQLNSIDVTKLW